MKETPSSPSRYSLRKRAPVVTDDEYDSFLENLLEQHEEAGERKRAEQHMRENQRLFLANLEPVPLDALPSPCIDNILRYVGSTTDIFNLAFTNKFILSHVNYEVVIRAAVFEDVGSTRHSNVRKAIKEIMADIKKQSIHVPSPLRLIRLLNAKRCELGDTCWGYNLQSKTSKALDRKNCDRSFGLILCDACVKANTTVIISEWRGWKNFTFGEDRLATHQGNRMLNPNVAPDANTGPRIHAMQIVQIESSYSASDEQKKALRTLIDDVFGVEGSDERNRCEQSANSLVEIYEKAEADAVAYVEAKKKMQCEEIESKRRERNAKRLERVRLVFDRLKSALASTGAPSELQDVAMTCTWHENEHYCLRFQCTFMESITEHLLSAPAGVTQKMITDAAARIATYCDLLESTQFLSFVFLSEGSTEESLTTIKRAMHDYCTTNLSPLKVLSNRFADENFFELLRVGLNHDALHRVLYSDGDFLSDVFSRVVVPDNHPRASDCRTLAKKVWWNKGYMKLRRWCGESTFKAIVTQCQLEYRRMEAAALAYIADVDTVAFLHSTVPPSNPNHNFTRQDAVNQVFNPHTRVMWYTGNNCPYNHLRSRNFAALRQIHKQYYKNGGAPS